MNEPKRLRVLGVCAGNGTNLHPFLSGNYEILGNIEPRGGYWSVGCKQWEANFGNIRMYKSVSGKGGFILTKKPNIIIGNPKCGASSIMRYSRSKKLGDAKSEPTIDLFIKCVNKSFPDVFMMENLPELLNQISKEKFRKIFSKYELIFHSGSVSMFGNSQISRKRLIIMGVKISSSRVHINQFKDIFPVNELKSTRSLLTPLKLIFESTDNLFNLRENTHHQVAMYDYRDPEKKKLSLREVRRLWRRDFKNENKWPIKTKKMHSLPGVYRNKADGYPMTVRKENRQFRWDGKNHTPRELAMIQGFPLSFKLYYDKEYDKDKRDLKNKNYWLNKARFTIAQSPPYEVGIWFKQCLEKGLHLG